MDNPAPTEEPDRHLRLAGTRNLRDVGGYRAGPDRVTRWRTLLRTDALDRLPKTSQSRLLAMGIGQVIDLRWPSELAERPSVFASSAAVRYLTVPLLDNPPAPPEGLIRIYRRALDERGPELASIVRALLAPGGLPAIIGCAGGIDRTGVTIALILTAVGVSAEVVAADYSMSSACFATDGRDGELDDWRAGSVAVDCRPEYMIETLRYLETNLGGAAGMLALHGIGPGEIDELRERLTEPVG